MVVLNFEISNGSEASRYCEERNEITEETTSLRKRSSQEESPDCGYSRAHRNFPALSWVCLLVYQEAVDPSDQARELKIHPAAELTMDDPRFKHVATDPRFKVSKSHSEYIKRFSLFLSGNIQEISEGHH